jgi:asparagine synthase (glutamine-hydrolysing)
MCGIAGLINFETGLTSVDEILTMSRLIRHRGPDDVGFILGNTHTGDFSLWGGADTPSETFLYPSPYCPVARLEENLTAHNGYNMALLNRRLAIVDLTSGGHQPLCNEDGTLWIVYNGEIYNLPELRSELETRGHQFHSHSDTEMILHAYEEWGQNCLTRFNGMWAFVIWDTRQHRLFVARDRTGIKPLYYWQTKERIAFSSEIKVLLALGAAPVANPQAVFDYLAGNLTDHGSATFFQAIHSLAPAHAMSVDLRTGQQTQSVYWQIDPQRRLDYPSEGDYVEQFRSLFEDAVRVHLLSDRPVGTCLSGGLDSSSIVAMIARLIGQGGLHVVGMEKKQKTFSARYRDFSQDEGRFIQSVIDAFDVDPFMTYPTFAGLQEEWQTLFYHQEEPFGSSSIFAQWHVFRLARQQGVTVTLDGQGGDELLAGYLGVFPFFFVEQLMHRQFRTFLTEMQAHIQLHNSSLTNELRNIATNLAPVEWKLARKVQALAGQAWLRPDFSTAMTRQAVSRWNGMAPTLSRFRAHALSTLTCDPLPSLLRFADRNSMAHSIESRVPFLDYRLIEFCFALPLAQKIRKGETKSILRQAMRGILPEEVRSRHDKIGFATPQDAWLRQMGGWIGEVFASDSFRLQPYINTAELQRLLKEHVAGCQSHTAVLWRCLAVELWRRAMKVNV